MTETVRTTAGWLLICPTTPGLSSAWIGATTLAYFKYSLYGIIALTIADSKKTGKVTPSSITAVLRTINIPRLRWRR